MPGLSIAGCRTASAFDSLPRNQRGSSAAIHRLRATSNAHLDSPGDSTRAATPLQEDDFATPSRPASASNSPSRRQEGRSGSTTSGSSLAGGLLRRSSSAKSKASSMAGRAFSPSRRRTLSRPGIGSRSISSVDLPPASSDLERSSSQVENRSPLRQGILMEDIGGDHDEVNSATARGGRASADIFRPATSMANRRVSYDGHGHGLAAAAAAATATPIVARSAPSSPKKHRSTKSLSISGPISSPSSRGGIEGGPRVAGAAAQRPNVSAPAKKRVVDKSSIGLPTNFQHTGHIGAANYGAALTQVDAAALAAQLSEVAAALQDFDLGPLPGSGPASSSPSSRGDTDNAGGMPPPVGHTLDTVVEADDTPAASRILGPREQVVAVAAPAESIESKAPELDSFAPASAQADSPVTPAPAPESSDFVPPSASSQSVDDTAESIRAVPRDRTMEDLAAAAPSANPSPIAAITALPFHKPITPVWKASPSVAGGHSATLGYAGTSISPSSPTPGAGGNQTPTRRAVDPTVPASVRGSGSPSMPGTSGPGRGKRKPVPRGAMGLHDLMNGTSRSSSGVDEAPKMTVEADDEQDKPLNPLPASLERAESTVGELPRLGGSGANTSSRTSGAGGSLANSLRGTRRASPLERAEMVAKRRLEEAQSRVLTRSKAGPESSIGLYLGEEEEGRKESQTGSDEGEREKERESQSKMAGSIRVAGKRMVPGPSGDYITDTANGRWNSALADITRALAASSDLEMQGGGLGNEEERREREERNGKTEKELIEEGLRQADEVLRRLEVDA